VALGQRRRDFASTKASKRKFQLLPYAKSKPMLQAQKPIITKLLIYFGTKKYISIAREII